MELYLNADQLAELPVESRVIIGIAAELELIARILGDPSESLVGLTDEQLEEMSDNVARLNGDAGFASLTDEQLEEMSNNVYRLNLEEEISNGSA